jgi:phosphatidylglycerophosphatase A
MTRLKPFLPRHWILTWFGSGLIPKAPGTAGTLATMPLVWFLCAETSVVARLVIATALTALACWLAAREVAESGRKDPQYIVVDESVGILYSTAWLPAAEWPWLLAAFVLFRLFDTLKPFPVNLLDQASKNASSNAAKGAFVILDDVGAGFLTAAALQAGRYWLG